MIIFLNHIRCNFGQARHHINRYKKMYICRRFFLGFCALQPLDGVEMFAGRATVTRCLRAGGLNVTALNIEYWDHVEERARDGKPRPAGNALDILSRSGFLLLDHFIFARASCSSSFMLCVCFFAKDSCDVHHAVPPGSLRGDHSHRMLQLGGDVSGRLRPHI